MRRRDLVELLEGVPRPVAASPELEQVRTPPAVAADLLWAAHDDGAIRGRRVLDLGCGTGMFAWGAAALGATATGIDVDAGAVEAARGLRLLGESPGPSWRVADLREVRLEAAWDTVVMNPPFGAQRGNRNADRVFYDRAVEAVGRAGTVWFLAQTRTEGFLTAMARGRGADVQRVGRWDYPLEAYYDHHADAARRLDVGGYRMAWPESG